MRQYAGFGDAEESNKRYRFLPTKAPRPQRRFDLPTRWRDSDHELARGEVGKVASPSIRSPT